MRTTLMLIAFMSMCLLMVIPLKAQTTTCGPEAIVDSNGYSGTASFNYGSSARSKSNNFKTAVAVGQTFLGFTENIQQSSTLGFFSRFLLPPFQLKVIATQGDLLDRIKISWEIDALGPSPNAGFNIYRDGVFLGTVGANIRSYNDFNVIPGRPYIYTVRGLNIFGEGAVSTALGFQVPNGVVTGWVSTLYGSPVPDAQVILTPMQGFSAKFDDADGAFAFQEPGLNPFLPAMDEDWTLTFWMKTDSASENASLIQMAPSPLFIGAINSTSEDEGLTIAISGMDDPFLTATFPDSTKNEWHHVVLSYDGNSDQGRLYIDGHLAARAPMSALQTPDTIAIGAYDENNGWAGRLDELRIYHHRLDELDFEQVMDGTASSETPFLSHYWKMDEELGEKSFDIVKRHKLYFCGAAFDTDRPPVHTAGVTNEDGYYRIESASYGTGTTFLAKPNKNFYMHRALKFERNEQDYATLPDFSITPQTTIELWLNSAGPDGTQYILCKKWGSNEFKLYLDPAGLDNLIKLNINGQDKNYGIIGSGYQHLAFTWDSLSGNMSGYLNGQYLNSFDFTGVSGNWSDTSQVWVMGARPEGNAYDDYFGGLIDEIAVYDTLLSPAIIQDHFENSRDPQEMGLRVYFPLDEGSGNRISNGGSVLLGGGTTFGTEWSAMAAHQMIDPHVFTPVTRQVTLNPSVTSVDQVDFIDRSTIPVTGYVRYKNTDCFANRVEILVNGESFNPKIFTDSTGKFVIDFDPGASAILNPKFEDHVFVPAFWELTNLSNPIAGLLFNDITTRTISGQVAGGTCKKSIITAPPGSGQGTVCIVKVSSADGCLQRQITLDNQEGNFVIENLPPIEKMQIAVVEHSNPLIKTAFEDQGGSIVDLTSNDTIIEFIYTAPPTVVIESGLDPYSPDCDVIVLEQLDITTLNIRLREQYVATQGDDGICALDTAVFHIINGFGDETIDTTMGNGLLTYSFRTGTPNPSPPFLKTLQIIGTSLAGVEGSLTLQGVVTGLRAKENTFTTLLPEIPTLILRDPPGDGSYSFIEENKKFCKTTEIINDFEIGGGGGITLHLGGDQGLVLAPLGFGVIEDISSTFDIGAEAQLTYQRLSANSFETCVSVNSRISTSASDLIVGGSAGGDVYMGDALNIVFGFADLVTFNDSICAPVTEIVLNVEPGDFATTFIYSEFYIQSTVMPYLEALANDPMADSATVARYLESLDRWQAILDNNAAQKENARLLKNISFDAGIEYEYAETSDTSYLETITNLVNSEFKLESSLGFEFAGYGFTGVLRFVTATSNGGRNEAGIARGITTGYMLSDDDPLDAFTIDIGMDSVYKTPVFDLKAGQSSCPWEIGTANREGPNLQLAPGSQYVATNVPANEPAVFQLKLGNLSATNEDWTYGFTAVAADNPNGAVIKLNGQPLNYIQQYVIPYGTSQTVTLTVERGPIEYDYDSLLVAEISVCEYERNLALSIPKDSDPKFFSGIYIGAHFIRPCSEVNITVPQQGWVVFPDPLTDTIVDDDILRITVSGYNLNEPEFKLIRLQYRLSNGDGAWINLPGTFELFNPNWIGFDSLPGTPPELGPVFAQFFWQTAGLKDGAYEIRAVAVCTGDATDKPGYSQIIKGRIDREPPSLVGVPQPSDGVYQVGDEVSFTFNQDVNCSKLIQADIMNANNVGLYDATTNTLIDASITCVDNKIVINPLFQNEYYENHILRAELHNIEDLTGNKLIATDWEFYVDRNELAWLTDSVGLTKYADENKTITAKIHNRGGYPVPFSIQNAPEWVHISPDAGTIVANEIREINFTVDSTVALGWFSDSIVLHTETGENPFFMGGDELLPFGARNICRPPDWTLNPGQYQLTMTMNLRLMIEGSFAADPEDQVAVFIEGEVRGKAKLTYVPAYDFWEAFVTVYGNTADLGKPLVYEMFDASACLHYPGTLPGNFNFVSNDVVGTPDVPGIVSGDLLIREIPLNVGWNWISFNLDFPDSTINKVLDNLPNPANDLIKNQTAFSTYTNSIWIGNLNAINNTSMYQYQANKANTIKMIGDPILPGSLPIPIVAGWNWIGYIPNYPLSVDTALASFQAQAGDIIKSQTAFAQFVSNTVGWVGSLSTLRPLNGYLLKTATAGTITYPPQSIMNDDPPASRGERNMPTFWTVDATQYENSMTLIGMFEFNNANATEASMELGAFVGGEIRGVASAVYIDYLDAYMFFLTCYANKNGEQLQFRLFDPAAGEVLPLQERMSFAANNHLGSVEVPFPFTSQTTGISEVKAELSFDVQPNPFRDETVFRIELPAAQNLQLIVCDMDGRSLYLTEIQGNAGMNSFAWKGCTTMGTQLSNGFYLVRMATDQGILTKKVVLQR